MTPEFTTNTATGLPASRRALAGSIVGCAGDPTDVGPRATTAAATGDREERR